MAYHDLCGTKSGKILVHCHKTLTRFRVLRKIHGDIIFNLNPVHGEQTEDEGEYVQQEEQIPLIHNEDGQFFNESDGLFLVHITILYKNTQIIKIRQLLIFALLIIIIYSVICCKQQFVLL